MALPVTINDVEEARSVLADPLERGIIKDTPTVHSEPLTERTGGEVFLKLENLQRTGSFKVRGAYNKIASLPPEDRKQGVVCASAGNHAQGVALAARDLDVSALICMPEDAPLSKIQATRRLGAEVVLEGDDYNAAYARARELEDERGLAFVHPYDDPAVIAGQGTIGLELIDKLDALDTVLVGVGGGGLAVGIGVAIKAHDPSIDVIGIEPTGANALGLSLDAGERVTLSEVDTIADGLATRSCGALTFDLAKQVLDEVVTVDDDAIARSILHLLEKEKSLVEGAGAVGPAALLEAEIGVDDRTVACVISGGNIDVTLLENIIDRGLIRSGRFLKIEVPLADRPGTLKEVLSIIADSRANIEQIHHTRRRLDVGLKTAVVRIEMETRGHEHVGEVLDRLSEAGYEARVEP